MSDVRKPEAGLVGNSPFFYANVLDKTLLEKIIVENNIDWVIHFSALLSAIGEKLMDRALDVNINGFQNVIELGKSSCLFPSSEVAPRILVWMMMWFNGSIDVASSCLQPGPTT